MEPFFIGCVYVRDVAQSLVVLICAVVSGSRATARPGCLLTCRPMKSYRLPIQHAAAALAVVLPVGNVLDGVQQAVLVWLQRGGRGDAAHEPALRFQDDVPRAVHGEQAGEDGLPRALEMARRT